MPSKIERGVQKFKCQKFQNQTCVQIKQHKNILQTAADASNKNKFQRFQMTSIRRNQNYQKCGYLKIKIVSVVVFLRNKREILNTQSLKYSILFIHNRKIDIQTDKSQCQQPTQKSIKTN
ncbi:hypothetical protein ABPG72_010008 [Tetrahymena utriculariae]